MTDRNPPRARLGAAAAALLATAACTGYEPAHHTDVVSHTDAHGAACTTVAVRKPGARTARETESSTDCAFPPEGERPAEAGRRPLPDPDPGREWGWTALLTFTDAHGRACTLAATLLGSGAVDETALDCDYPPPGASPGADTRTDPPDPDPDSDDYRIEVASFTDAHGRACTTTTSKAAVILTGGGSEIDLTCSYPEDGGAVAQPSERPLPE
ncbi:hypothetical protein [Nocardiopsis potens]|uniref:hypothetical protein n=1 Tax=Nocardiopsis potens TaxID=1246458 RepID=UPI00034ADFEE|nr:hypothetical protein [Nocardiopsis potens]